MKRPSFFIVGAPKCGTSALNTYLQRHPDIFIPARKEIHYFGSDIVWPTRPETVDDYLQYFARARVDQIVGESSVLYLSSVKAPAEINDFCPNAKIIIMLRNPVDVLYSYYYQARYVMQEDIPVFEEALKAESKRSLGIGLPKHNTVPQHVLYRSTVRFAEQVERYLQIFGSERVLFVIYDDLKHDPAAVYKAVSQFLDVADDFVPEFEVINPNKEFFSRSIHRFIMRPPKWAKAIVSTMLPTKVAIWLRDSAYGLNTVYMPRPEMDPLLRKQLTIEFTPDVTRLSHLVGRDLSNWSHICE